MKAPVPVYSDSPFELCNMLSAIEDFLRITNFQLYLQKASSVTCNSQRETRFLYGWDDPDNCEGRSRCCLSSRNFHLV